MEPRKQAICDALRRFIVQRPGLEFGRHIAARWFS